jgi:hypothetical protein
MSVSGTIRSVALFDCRPDRRHFAGASGAAIGAQRLSSGVCQRRNGICIDYHLSPTQRYVPGTTRSRLTRAAAIAAPRCRSTAPYIATAFHSDGDRTSIRMKHLRARRPAIPSRGDRIFQSGYSLEISRSTSGTYVQKRTMYSSAAMRPRCGRFTGIRGRLSSTQLDIVLADVGDRAGRVALRLDTRTRHRAQVRSVPN